MWPPGFPANRMKGFEGKYRCEVVGGAGLPTAPPAVVEIP